MNKATLKGIRDGRKFENLTNPDSYNEQIRESWLPFWCRNTAENHPHIKEIFKKDNRDVSVLGQEAHKHCLVIGSGPSLNDWEPYLKDWDGDIMISSSHLAFFEAIGVKPTYCFIIDADPQMSHLVGDADTKDIRLITHPQMDPNILRLWEGDIYFFRMNDPGDDFFSKYVPMMYSEFKDDETGEAWPGIKAYVLNSGNVSNCQVALSQFMGYKNIFLVGVDLGFPEGKYRFDGYGRNGHGFIPIPDEGIPATRATKTGANGVLTDQVSCFYKYSTIILWGMDCPELYSCSRGILTEIPYVSPQDVIASQGDVAVKIPPEEKYKIAQTYLRYRGIYITKRASRVKELKNKPLRATKKKIIRYMLFIQWLKGNLTPELKKQTIRGLLGTPAVKFRVKWWEWQFEETARRRVLLGYSGITNKYHVKGFARLKVVVRFHVGRILKLW